ncbi:hypothetical protein MN116_008167 [Schistosoma mekongi]|uniref:Uncharacterized protein n=1 Tax=Schistosoma mekongi TaxID=38744 RepID=A0AAE1Z6F9_SCHME|nr:hypothetical protein MN116_008167 [Schistosoma mekongi]
MSSLTNYWKRFISTCATLTTSAGSGPSLASNYVGNSSVTTTSQNSLQKSSVEWQCLNETVNVLLKTCPVSRSAILEYLAPLYIDYFVVWWHINSGTTTSHNSNFESQNIRKAEVVLQECLKTINLLITQESVADHFLTAACSWCLMLIRPVCTAPPTQLLSNLMDLLKSHSRQQDSDKSSSTSRKTLDKSGTHSDSSAGNKISDRSRLNVMKSTNRRYDLKHKSDYNSSSSPSTPYHQLIVISDSDSCSSSSNDECDALAGEESAEMGADVKRNDGMISSNISRDAIETSDIKSLSTNIDKRDHASVNELNSTIISNNVQEISLNSNDQTIYSLRRHDFNFIGNEIIDLDLNPTSVVNQQILGLWVKCPVLIDLLNIVCNCLLGSDIRLCSVQALLASSTVPIWDSSLENCHSLANSVLPHWIIIWLLYQATSQKNLVSAGRHKLNELCDLILTCALHPLRPNILQCTLLPDTLAGYFSQKNFDFDFWITVCLTHLLFLGDSVPEFLDKWLRTKLEQLSAYTLLISNEASLNNDNVMNQNPLIHQPKLLHLLLNLSLISVPILPQPASEQQVPLTSSSETTDLGIDRLWRHPHPPKSTNYGIPSVSCRSACVSKEMECTSISPRFNVPPKHMNPMLSTSCHIPLPPTNIMNTNMTIGQPNFIPFRFNFSKQFEMPIRRPPPPPPLLHVPVNIPPNRSTSNDTHPALTSVFLFSERQSRNFLPLSGAERQPTSLLWVLSLIRRIKSVTLSTIIGNLITLTPLQLFALFRNQYESNYHSVVRMIQLFVKSILQAPVGSNVDRLLVYLINICDLEAPQLCSTPTFIITSTATTIASNTIEEADCPDAKKIKLDSDDQLSQRQHQSVLEYHKFFNNFLSYCREILRLLCETTIFLTYSSSETADLLDRGGCEGLLREALHLTNRPSISSLNNSDTNTNTTAILSDNLDYKLLSFSNSKCCLFQNLVSSNSLQNSTCAQLILSLGFTLDPSLMEYLLFYLCCWKSTPAKVNPDDDSFKSPVSIKSCRSSSSLCQSTYCPLMLFFPILNEIQSIWIARTFSRPPPLSTTTVTTASTTTGTSTVTPAIRPSIFPIMSIRSKYLLMNSHRMDGVSNNSINNTPLSFLYPNGLLYIHQLLASKFFPLLWSSLEKGNHEFRIRLLRNLLWLVYRELDLVAENFGHPRILFALAAQLDEIVNMMGKYVNSECLDLLLSLCECIFSIFRIPATNHLLRPTTSNSTHNQYVKLSESSCYYHRLPRFYHGSQNSKLINTNSRLRGLYYDSHYTFALIHLSPAQCIRLANSFVQLLSRLMLMVNESNLISESSSLSSCMHFYLLGRIRNLLNLLFNSIQSTVFQSTTMRLIPKVIMSSRVNPYIDDLLKIKMPTPINNLSDNLLNSNISCLSSNLFINSGGINTSKLSEISDSNSLLLINNPPKRFGYLFDDDQDGLIRGQLQPRINNNINHHNFIVQKGFENTRVLIHRGPGEGLLGSGCHSTENTIIVMNNQELDTLDCRLSGWLHWLNLMRFIVMSEKHLYQFCNVEFWNYSVSSNVNSPMQRSDHFTGVQLKQLSLLNNNRQLISGLEDIAIQGSSSIHLPQTSITCLPFPSVNLVLPPSGVVLERVLCILYWFLPEVKRLMTNNNITTTASITTAIDSIKSSSNNLSSDFQNKLSQFSSQGILELSVILEKINLNTYGFPPLNHPLPMFASYFTESSALESLDPIPLLSTPKVLLGLLMGLEAVWASPLAPRISIGMAIKCLTHLNNGTYMEQSFPVVGASDVCKAHAHKIIVDYAHRRLDTNSTIFKFTNKLLLYLMEVCCLQDCLEMKQQQKRKNKMSSVNSKFPSEQLVKDAGDNWQHNFVTTQCCAPLDCLLHCLTPRELAILLSDIRRNLRLRMAFYHIKQQKTMAIFSPGIGGICCDRLSLTMMLNPLPPTPAFITPGLLIALIQAHLMEDGIADCFGSLIHSMEVLTQYIATTNQQLIDDHNKSHHSNSRRSTEKHSPTDCNVIKAVNSDTIIVINVEGTEEKEEDLEEEQDTIVEEVNLNGEEVVIVE